MTTLTQASYEFMNRPSDQRFTSLTNLHEFTTNQHDNSVGKVVSSRKINFASTDDKRGLVVQGNHQFASPTNWSFSQLSTLSGVPADLLKTQCENNLAPLAADNLNAGFKVVRDVKDVGILVRKEGVSATSETLLPSDRQNLTLAAATGPNYGRIWNSQVTQALCKRFGNGIDDTSWTVPGFFGTPLDEITKENTTLFASDRDMFVFLADEKNKITIPNRRGNESGALSRGFFVWNSEVGSKTMGIAFFLFDYSCCNRIVWGVEEYQKIAIRHTSSAPDRWLEEIVPTLGAYAHASAAPIEARLKAAQQHKIDNAEEFLASRFGPKIATKMIGVHDIEELKPIETMWDAVTAVTAYARTIEHQDTRVEIEREGGKLLDLAKLNKTTFADLEEAF